MIKKWGSIKQDCVGKVVEDAVNNMKDGEVILLENVRFYKGEEKKKMGEHKTPRRIYIIIRL